MFGNAEIQDAQLIDALMNSCEDGIIFVDVKEKYAEQIS